MNGVSTLHKCACCHKECESLHRHHVLPKVLGGVDEDSNIVKCCEECHGKIHDRDMLNHRKLTIEGLRKAKERGVKLGGNNPNCKARNEKVKELADIKAKQVKPVLEEYRKQGLSYIKIAENLNKLNVPTERGGKWYGSTVRNYYTRVV